MGGRSAVGAAAAVWVGILAGDSLGVGAIVAVLGLASIAGWLALRAPARTGTVAILLALASAAAARGGAHRLALESTRAPLGDGDRLYRIEGRVLEPPQRESGEPAVLVAIEAASPRLSRGARVRLRLPASLPVEWSDRIEAIARIEAPLARRNPGGYDARAAASANDVVGTGRAFFARATPASGLAGWPRATIVRWRRAVDRQLATASDPTRELIVPLVVGDRSALSNDLSADMRASGLVHLLALSGLHVAWMAGIARGVIAACGGGTLARALAGAGCALFYAGIAGPIPSLMRAALTETIAAAARGRALDAVQALALTVLAWLGVAPGWAFDLGFQLSCAATLGLLAITIPLEGAGGWRSLARSLVAGVGAQLAALPLLIARFHAIAWTAPFANLVAVPICGLLLTAAWLGTLLELLAPGSGTFAFHACEALAAALRATCRLAAQVPGAMIATGHHGLPVWLAGVGAILLAVALPRPRDLEGARRPMSRARFIALASGALASALAMLAAALAPPMRPPADRFWVVALDVGQGDAIAIGFADGWWLVDAGPRSPRFDAGHGVVLPFFRWAAVRRLDTIVFTHDDGDHTGGGEAVVRSVPAARIACAVPWLEVPGPASRFGARGYARGAMLRVRPLVRVLWPPAPGVQSPVPIDADNRASLVIEVALAGRSVVLLGDADSLVERALDVPARVALLKVGHHGSGSSSGASFLARARPVAAAVSCGRRNPFGHPERGAIARLAAAGARVHRTDREGALWFEVGPDGVRRLDWPRGVSGAVDRAPAVTGLGAALRHP